jgi:hypothetical protein
MNRHALLPLAVFFIGAGFVLAGNAPTPVARSFPWTGFLEENGFAVTGHREIGITLFTAAQQTTPCDGAVFDDVEVVAGRFHVVVEGVAEECLADGLLYFDMAVGPVGGQRTALVAASGEHTRLHTVPFASANDVDNRFLVGPAGDVQFENAAGKTVLTAGEGTGVSIKPLSVVANTQTVFAVRDVNGAEMASVAANGDVAFGATVAGASHELDASGDAFHRGDLTVGGALSSTCPTGMTFVAGWCIDNTRGNNGAIQTYNQAMRFCHGRGKMLCSYDALAACDELQPSTSDCRTKTNEEAAILWSSTRHSDRGDFEAQYQTRLMCYRNGKIHQCDSSEAHDYYCCSHAYTGAP